MAKTIAQLHTEAQTIRDATLTGENTATRVGTLFDDLVDKDAEYEVTKSQVDYLTGDAVADFSDITGVGRTDASILDISLDSVNGSINILATGAKTSQKYVWFNVPSSLVNGKQYRVIFKYDAQIAAGCDGYISLAKGHSSSSDYLNIGVNISSGIGKKTIVFTKTSQTLYFIMSSSSIGGTGSYVNITDFQIYEYAAYENIKMITDDISELQDHTFDNATRLGYYYGNRIPSLSRQRIGYKKLMNNAYCQGGTAYGGYYFQFTNYHASMSVYSLVTNTLHSTIAMTSVTTDHCNTACFGNTFYDVADQFPLLYTSGSQTATYNHIQVWRIQLINDVFSITQVQEITLPTGTAGDSWNWGQAYLDNDAYGFSFLWYATMMSKGIYFRRFNTPPIFDGGGNVISQITLTEADVKDTFEGVGMRNQQGGVVRNGILYLFDGVPAFGTGTQLYIYDLWNKGLLNIIDIYNGLGITTEFEGCGIYNDTLIANTNGGGIFAIYF